MLADVYYFTSVEIIACGTDTDSVKKLLSIKRKMAELNQEKGEWERKILSEAIYPFKVGDTIEYPNKTLTTKGVIQYSFDVGEDTNKLVVVPIKNDGTLSKRHFLLTLDILSKAKKVES